ncbi:MULTISPECIES: hypothetical protein [unclassified Ruegeria]|uniref:hypothetical protein n=1 Tax=unclassified Ruegeria TaxID=2625375 RepID=UPI00148899E9|nr:MULTISPECIES: hypothetical protein [unclassified Ruegeria]NOD65545.1 hypothetical protein [Ruegeria sp. HKCCD6109]
MFKSFNLTMAHAVIISAAVFCVATLPGLMLDGYNPDDWRQVHGAPAGGMPLNWTTEEGRWAMEALYVFIMGERFLTPIQAPLAFACLFWISWVLAQTATDTRQTPFAAATIFSLSVCNIYMIDALNFSSHVFAFPLALALSLQAYRMFWTLSEQHIGIGWFARALLAIQMLALSCAIYQPFAPFGALFFALQIMRYDKISSHIISRAILMALAGSVFAILIYLLEWRVAVSLSSHTAEATRFSQPGLEKILQKIASLPTFWKTLHSGGLQNTPKLLRLMYAAVFGVALLASGISMLRGFRTSGLVPAVRIAIGAFSGLFILPITAWFTYSDFWMPGRVVAYLPFAVIAVLITAGHICGWWLPKSVGGRLARGAAIALGAVSIALSIMVWSDQVETGRRDTETAQAIYKQVSETPGFDGNTFRLSGGLDYPELSWGGMLGWSVFHHNNPMPGIFSELYNRSMEPPFVAASPIACPAFPDQGAVFHDGHTVHVCLEPSPGLKQQVDCIDLGNDETLCRTKDMLVWQRPACEVLPLAGAATRFRLKNSDGRERLAVFTLEDPGVPLDGRCHYAQRLGRFEYQAVIIEHFNGTEWEAAKAQTIP